MRLVIHLKDLPDHVGIAGETLLPEVVAEHEDRRGALLVLARLKCTTEERLHPEQIEEVIRNYAR